MSRMFDGLLNGVSTGHPLANNIAGVVTSFCLALDLTRSHWKLQWTAWRLWFRVLSAMGIQTLAVLVLLNSLGSFDSVAAYGAFTVVFLSIAVPTAFLLGILVFALEEKPATKTTNA